MPRAPKLTYADRVNYHLCKKTNLNAFNPDDEVEDIVQDMEARGEPVSRCARTCMRTYFKNLIIHRRLCKYPLSEGLVQPSEKFRHAIEAIREREANIDEDDDIAVDIARISLLLRVAVGKMKNLTAKELREKVLELSDDNDALRAEIDALRKEKEDFQVDCSMLREERDQRQNENSELGAENASLRAQLVELQAAPRDSTSPTTADSYHTAPSSPRLGSPQPPSTLSRVPTEIIPPVTPPRATVSRSASGLPTPPTTDARRAPGPQPSRSGSRASVSSRRSFSENAPGAASVRGATPGSPSGPPRRSPPLRQVSNQNLDRASTSSSSSSGSRGKSREHEHEHSLEDVRAMLDGLDRDTQRRCDEQRAQIKLTAEATERAMEKDTGHLYKERLDREDREQRIQALTASLRQKEEEFARVCVQLETLEAQHLKETQKYQTLVGEYNDLRTRMETLTTILEGLTGQGREALNRHPEVPVTGATA